MYPYFRTALILWQEGRKPRLDPLAPTELSLRCWPVDIDMFLEMNNGRILTLCDLGRFGLSARVGLMDVLKREGWGLVVAGASVRYRARIMGFQKFTLKTRLLGWDARFFYFDQSMWRGETCCNQALVRTGVTEKGRLVASDRVAHAMGRDDTTSPDLPDWARAWAEADATRPWPPVAAPPVSNGSAS